LAVLQKTFDHKAWPVFFLVLWLLYGQNLFAKTALDIEGLAGEKDAVLISDHQGKILFSKNAHNKLVPASILKIFTSLLAFEYLGDDYRFVTDLIIDNDSNLKIKGYGDPLLISETLSVIAWEMKSRLEKLEVKNSFNDIVLDDSYFESPIIIPGRQLSLQPYDAPNSALCVNFNTVYFKRTKKGSYVSAEPQTPLLPFVLNRITASRLEKGRILLSGKDDDAALYAGHLFKYFLEKEGLQFKGAVKIKKDNSPCEKLVYRYVSMFSLKEVVSKLLDFSNNYIANQVLLACGAKAFGPPGTLEKGTLAASNFARDVLELEDIKIVEGSGISRENKISAIQMLKILEYFEPHHTLMRQTGKKYFKTGTLNGVSTQAGYIKTNRGELYRFVVILNTKGKAAEKIVEKIVDELGD
jgi:D-alanyl-D-alanine carboxypeptidase/D-alanyl-D-alanine-endopeptidase (penicillin-binding protein 4)